MKPNRILHSRPYQLRKRALPDGETRRKLELAEEAIIVDPLHRSRRFDRPDGSVADLNERGIMVIFQVLGDTLVLIDFRVL